MTTTPASPCSRTGTNVRMTLGAVALFSAAVNVLLMAGPLFMLQIYDRVLPSHSGATLAVLFGLVLFLNAGLAVLDVSRADVLVRLSHRIRSSTTGDQADLARRALADPAAIAAFDLPFVPIFVGCLALLDPYLGLSVLVAAASQVLVVSWLHRARRPLHQMAEAANRAVMAQDLMQHDKTDEWLGLRLSQRLEQRDARVRDRARHLAVMVAAATARTAAGLRSFRLVTQSAILALSAALVLAGDLSAGAIAASSVLAARALGPVDQMIPALRLLRSVRGMGGGRHAALPLSPPASTNGTGHTGLIVRGLDVTPPTRDLPALQGISFSVGAGEIVGIAGRSGVGKTALARALAGVWPVDGATITSPAGAGDGAGIGYLPQRNSFFEGTIAENIARFDPDQQSAAIVAAARLAGAHDLILSLPAGYATRIGNGDPPFSQGELRRIGMARAVYRMPRLLILDEPDLHEDETGIRGLTVLLERCRTSGASVVLIAHRPSLLRICDRLLVLAGGRIQHAGPTCDVLARLKWRGEHPQGAMVAAVPS